MAEDSDWFTCQKRHDNWWLLASDDPYDTSCVMSYLQDPTQDGCVATQDQDGKSCLWCSLAGLANVCLSQEQADMASSLGVTCETTTTSSSITNPSKIILLRGGSASFTTNDKQEQEEADPYDTSCLMAYLTDPTEDGCKAAVDEDGEACKFCTFQDSINLCLTEEQAEMGEQFGLSCNDAQVETWSSKHTDPFDPTCALAFLQDQSEDACKSAVDADGNPCEFCTLQGAFNMCLNDEQAQVAEQYGAECDGTGKEEEHLSFPSDFWDCLENYDESGCAGNSCTWCNTEVGVAFCVSDAIADAFQECNFFDCNYKNELSITAAGPAFDSSCLKGSESEKVCDATNDVSGRACVWCDAAGVFGLCMDATSAQTAGEYLSCGAVAEVA